MPPPGVRLVLGVLVASLITGSQAAYSLSFYDCHNIRNLLTFKVSNTCNRENPDTEMDTITTTFTLLQKQDIVTMDGYSCRIKYSRFVDYCGAYSHSKVITTPEVEISHVLSPMDCLDLIHTQVFTTPDGIKRPVSLEAENIYRIEELGSISIGEDTISCQGQPKKVGGHIINEVLQIAQWKVVAGKERFRVKDGEVEATRSHLRLPLASCSVGTMGCRLHDITYVWQPPRNRCPMEAIRTLSMTQESGFLLNTDLNILLKKGNKIPSPPGCPPTDLWETEYPDILLTTSGEDWPDMKEDIDINDYIKARDDYIMWTTERLLQRFDRKTQGTLCQETLDQPGQLIKLDEEGVFYRRNGDTVQRFECPKKTAELASSLDICYHDIPLANNGGFVKPETRTLTTFSAPIPCNQHYGLKIITEEGVWIEFKPTIHKIAEPLDLPIHTQTIEHKDLSQGGLFTDGELESWRKHIELGDLQNAVTKTISYGICAEDGNCDASPGIPGNNLRFINNEADTLTSSWNITTKIHKFVQDSGAYLSLIVLILELIKFLNFTAAIALTIAREGIEGCKALVWILCCHPHQAADRVNRRHRRLNLKRKRHDSDDVIERMELANVKVGASMEPDL